jgi:pimeloyl-ACP methyl ester carboxylesterase
MPRRAGFWLVAFSSGLLGCAGIGIRPIAEADLVDASDATALSVDDLSARSLQVLRRLDLEASYRRFPGEAFAHLQAIITDDPRPELLFVAAELAYLLGRHYEKSAPIEACSCFYLCAGFSYHYLFDRRAEDVPTPQQMLAARLSPDAAGDGPYDPRFRLACDLYNGGLAKCIRAAQTCGRLDPSGVIHLATGDGKLFTLSVQHHGFICKPEDFTGLAFCNDYEVKGLANQYHNYGLGVPLIGTSQEHPHTTNGVDRYPRVFSYPVTALFRFEGSVAELTARRDGRLELYNPLVYESVPINGRDVPLEADLTTPLAYLLAHSGLADTEYTGFLNPGKAQVYSGVYLFEPYQRGKIPVVMVHGLLSSPLTWAPMFNDLRADPLLRERFQFWFYLYPTGNPYFQAAADLRRLLAQLRLEFDPEGTDEALQHLTLVGHSMGGLVSHLLTVDSGDDFWHLVSREPIDKVKLSPEARADLKPLFYFQRQPAVERVVFIGTPHRGSKLSPSLPGRLAAHFVELPQTLRHAAGDLGRDNPGLGKPELPTSVDLLAPGAPALMLLASRPHPDGVHFHSILGQAPPHDLLLEIDSVLGQKQEPGDGVVPYSSAHLEDVDSEIIVEADHNHVHQHPRAVAEVRRILLEHWRELNKRAENPAGVQPSAN